MKTKSIYLSGLALLFVVAVGYLVQKQRLAEIVAGETVSETEVHAGAKDQADDHRDVVLRVSTPQDANAVMQNSTNVLTFEILNNGRFPIMCPDSWSLLFDDGRVQRLSLPRSGNIRVQPGGKGTIAITNPVTTGAWRLVASYYFEDIVFDAKVKIDHSALKNVLPLSVRGVEGLDVMSDWIK